MIDNGLRVYIVVDQRLIHGFDNTAYVVTQQEWGIYQLISYWSSTNQWVVVNPSQEL